MPLCAAPTSECGRRWEGCACNDATPEPMGWRTAAPSHAPVCVRLRSADGPVIAPARAVPVRDAVHRISPAKPRGRLGRTPSRLLPPFDPWHPRTHFSVAGGCRPGSAQAVHRRVRPRASRDRLRRAPAQGSREAAHRPAEAGRRSPRPSSPRKFDVGDREAPEAWFPGRPTCPNRWWQTVDRWRCPGA